MTIGEAIEIAIDNGYRPPYGDENSSWLDAPVIKPEFWQALGKGMGWKCQEYRHGFCDCEEQPWLQYWHIFIDDLADGGTIESYFKKL